MIRHLSTVVFWGAVGSTALAQSPQAAWIIELSRPTVSPSSPSVNVRISARFPPADYAWAHSRWDVLLGEGVWSDVRSGYIGRWGTIQNGDVLNIDVLQLNEHPVMPDRSNPITVWQGTWTASSFSQREVRVTTATSHFDVYFGGFIPQTRSRLDQLVEGAALIRVIPAPMAGAFLLAALAVPRRRS